MSITEVVVALQAAILLALLAILREMRVANRPTRARRREKALIEAAAH
jgi:hypothetical protein